MLTPEMVQQITVSAFSALGLQVKVILHQSLLVDSGASNQMTSSTYLLQNICPYHGSEYIKVFNGNHLPIIAISDITPTFNNTFASPGLSNNLLSDGQLAENNWDVHFSRSGCCVQDQVSRMVIEGAYSRTVVSYTYLHSLSCSFGLSCR